MKIAKVLIAGVVFFISAIFALCNYFAIQYQFFIWEILVDIKSILLLGAIYFLYKKFNLNLVEIFRGWFQFSLKGNIVSFLSVLLFAVIAVIVGILFKQTQFSTLKNPETLLLGMLFDIPAVYIFSATTILIEEIFFRVFLPSLLSNNTIWNRAVFSTLLWSIYFSADFVNNNIEEISIIFLFSCALGFFVFALKERFNSVWLGYSFRIGVIAVIPLFVTSLLSESDSFYSASTSAFVFEGIPTSISLLFLGLYFIYTKPQINEKIAKS